MNTDIFKETFVKPEKILGKDKKNKYIPSAMEGTLAEPAKDTTSPWNRSTGGSPWGKTSPVQPCSLEDVMSEQLATDLQAEEQSSILNESKEVEPEIQDLITSLEAEAGAEQDTSSDIALARMLQMQYDKEHNQLIQAQEKKYNGTGKVSISFENYKSLHPAFRDDDDDQDEEYEIEEQKSPWEEETPPDFNKHGYSGKGKNITTKHDAVICGRKNASKMMEFPPEFVSGDGEGMDMQLPNHVYNKLKRHSEKENKRQQKLHEKKEHSTAEHAMDPRTRLLMYKMVNNGTLESISGSVSTGKESVVFHAQGGTINDRQMPAEVALKVFKTTIQDFKNREKYVHGDHRFSRDDYKKWNPRRIIKMWAMKETANLNRMRKFDIPCPKVELLRKHILAMTFIGENQRPAPKIKDARLPPEDMQIAYNQMISIMKTMYRKCHLVHADLSEFNILWHKDQAWVIDVSQAVDITHPFALEFLYRDCANVSSFFTKGGVYDVPTAEAMFNKVTKLNIQGTGADFISQVQKFSKEKREELLATHSSTKEYQFDFFWEKSEAERLETLGDVVIEDSGSDEEEEEVVEEELTH